MGDKHVLDLFDLRGRVVIITGGAGLLGAVYTRALLEAGARVVIADNRLSAAKEAVSRFDPSMRGRVLPVQVDVSRVASVNAMVGRVMRAWGRIDVLINNAAIDAKFDKSASGQAKSAFENYPLAQWQRDLDVNLTAAFLCAQAVGKVMKCAGGGVMINIGSTYGVTAPDQRLYREKGSKKQTQFKPAGYAVTKAGVLHLTRYLAAYWGRDNIRVNSLTPGGVFTDHKPSFVRRYAERTPMGRMADKDELRGAVLFLSSDASSYMTGANLVIDGGWTAW